MTYMLLLNCALKLAEEIILDRTKLIVGSLNSTNVPINQIVIIDLTHIVLCCSLNARGKRVSQKRVLSIIGHQLQIHTVTY